MKINGSMILKLLETELGRYILHDDHEGGIYRLKKANGDDVTFAENGKVYPIHPDQRQIDDLVDACQLVREGAKYRLPEATSEFPASTSKRRGAMILNGSTVLQFLGEKPGRYILRTLDHYGMQEANGKGVETPALLLTAERIEELLDANQLVRDGANKYVLNAT